MKKLLVINSGSATLKFKIYAFPELEEELFGVMERIGLDTPFLEIKEKNSQTFFRQTYPERIKNHEEAFEEIMKRLKNYQPNIKFVGHRVVHGGQLFSKTTKVSMSTLAKLEKFNELAPLHNPVNLACLKKSLALIPKAAQFAVFDTAYYRTIPDYAYLYALPEKFCVQYGIRRYGFHGISHEYAAREGAKKTNKPIRKLKIITCHLGGGSSLTATKFGQAVETTMGFTPLEGLTMSTRVGDIDAAVPLYMIKNLGLSADEVENIFNFESGILGVAGLKDMREILAAAGEKVVDYKNSKKFNKVQKAKSKLALKMFIYDIVRYIGQMATVMKGLDLLVFTGGIGERSPTIRKLILKELKFLGKFKTAVIPANEELMIAREILKIKS